MSGRCESAPHGDHFEAPYRREAMAPLSPPREGLAKRKTRPLGVFPSRLRESFAMRAVIPANAGIQRNDSASDFATLIRRRFLKFG